MKILYDHQIFYIQKYGGISRYFYEIIDKLQKKDNVQCDISIKHSNNYYIAEYLDIKPSLVYTNPVIKYLSNASFKGHGRLKDLYTRFKPQPTINILDENINNSLSDVKDGKYDVFHPTYYDTYYLDAIPKKPFVVTVYDMIHELFPEHFAISDPTSYNKKLLVTAANHVIAISEKTKTDLVDIYNIDPKKISVIYLANSLGGTSKKISDQSQNNYVLYVGQRVKYKNFYFMCHVLSAIIATDPKLNIVCAGGGQFSEEEIAFFKRLKIDNNIKHIDANDDQLLGLYQNALALIVPSLYEGFGIPLVEAFANGCPVICSNAGSLPEVGGDAAVYFDPKSYSSMKDAITNTIYSPSTRSSMINKGKIREKDFRWTKIASQTLDVYRSVA